MARHIAKLSSKSSLLLLCDLQEKFRPTIKYFPQIVETSNKLLQTCKILDVPYIVTEQYPKGRNLFLFSFSIQREKHNNNLGLGRTVSELQIGDAKPFEKTLFSMCTPDVTAYMKQKVKGTFHHRRQTKSMKLF